MCSYGLDRPRLEFWQEQRAFSSHKRPDLLRGPRILVLIGNRMDFTRSKAAGKCVDHSTLSILLPRIRINEDTLLIPCMFS